MAATNHDTSPGEQRNGLIRLLRSQLGRNTLWMIGCDTLAKLIGMITTIVYANVLGRALFGVFSFVFCLAQIFSIFPDMGLHRWAVQDIARQPKGSWQLFQMLRRMKALLAAMTLIAGVAAGVIVALLKGQSALIVMTALAVAALCVRGMKQNFDTLFYGHQRMQWPAALNLLMRALTLIVGTAIAWKTKNVTLLFAALLVIEALDYLISGKIATGLFQNNAYRDEQPEAKDIVRGALPFSLQMLATLLYFYMDTVMLGLMWNDDVVAYYNAGYRLVLAALVVPSSLCNVLFPAMAERTGEKALALYRKTLPLFILIGLGFVLVVFPFREFWVDKVLYRSGEYAMTVPLLGLLAWSFPIYCISMCTGNYFGATKRQTQVMIIGSAMAVTNLMLNLLWIPRFAAFGAAAATVATEFIAVLCFIGCALYTRRCKNKSAYW
ncbi:flippase [Candidatus Sumerlaeota bacterium]|nr:flippase [Candidatus Sumerlaeota bacterium]